jgi:hypothetical protein
MQITAPHSLAADSKIAKAYHFLGVNPTTGVYKSLPVETRRLTINTLFARVIKKTKIEILRRLPK